MATQLEITVEKVLILQDFPSGSAMEFFEGNIYLMGDDARQMLIMDNDYQPVHNITMFDGVEKRIEKKMKSDIEASAIITYNNKNHLLVLGSASKSLRERVYLFQLPANNNSTFIEIDTDEFTDRIKRMETSEINIEGSAAVGDVLLLSNRGNKTNPANLVFVTSTDFFDDQKNAPITILKTVLPEHNLPVGISSLSYYKDDDTLYFTASTELTDNAYDDGTIGDSYLGIIEKISTKLSFTETLYSRTLMPDALINLTEKNTIFKGQKIESICIEKADAAHITAHLVSDNDNGESTLFKVLIQKITNAAINKEGS